MRELERLQLALAPEGLGMSLADGGVPVEDLSQGYPEADWDTVLGDMFLESSGENKFKKSQFGQGKTQQTKAYAAKPRQDIFCKQYCPIISINKKNYQKPKFLCFFAQI
jgi:hypothetical protein